MRPVKASPGTYTLRAAATAAGVSVSTLRRRKDALVAAGATVEPTGWSVPESALRAVFPETPPVTAHDSPADTPLVQELRDQIAWLRQQIEDQNRTIARQAEAHAVIAAKLTQQLEGTEKPETAANTPTTAPQSDLHRRKWWHAFGR